MAEPAGNEELLDSTSNEDVPKPINNQQNILKKNEDISSNGTLPCSSFATANKSSSNVLRPSVLAMNVSAGSPMSAFSSSNFGNSSHQNVGNSSQKNPFSLRPSVFGSVGSPTKVEKKPVILRASQLELSGNVLKNTTNNKDASCVLTPAKLSNPFLISESRSEGSSSPKKSSSTNAGENLEVSVDSEKVNSSHISKVPQVSFVPLGITASSGNPGSSQTSAHPGTASTAPSFVFGQNLLDRVEVPTEAARASSETDNNEILPSEMSSCDGNIANTNGSTPEMLFSSVIRKELSDKQSEVGNDEKKRKSLTEAAREYEESRANKRKYEEVAVKTGEEEEINVLQMNCKLFAFNKEKSTWVERGRGTLRLNDLTSDNRTQSRVVMRVSGSLRVVLNTKIWPEMSVDKPSEKSVRLTAMDGSGEIKVFLVMAGLKEIDHLFKALEWRVNNQKRISTASQKCGDTSSS